MNQFLAATGVGREVPSQHQGGFSGCRSAKTGQVKLPFRNVEKGAFLCWAGAKFSVQMSELVFVTGSERVWDELGSATSDMG